MAQVHDRMPAIIPRDRFAAWLDADGVEPQEAADLLRPAPEAMLELVEIGPAVNRVANDSESVQTPVAPPIRFAEEH
jgi:putative SOS response-associated peptidase YedK